MWRLFSPSGSLKVDGWLRNLDLRPHVSQVSKALAVVLWACAMFVTTRAAQPYAIAVVFRVSPRPVRPSCVWVCTHEERLVFIALLPEVPTRSWLPGSILRSSTQKHRVCCPLVLKGGGAPAL